MRPGRALTGALIAAVVLAYMRPAHGQDLDLPNALSPPPFLEGTELFWTARKSTNLLRVANRHILEADIFPHFVVGPPTKCRRGKTRFQKFPCISVTTGVRLRMEDVDSAPIESPSFMPRLNIQWFLYGNAGLLHGLAIRAGHHSNGQAGCLLTWTGTGPRPLEDWHRDLDPRRGYVTSLVPTAGECADRGWLDARDNPRHLVSGGDNSRHLVNSGTLDADTKDGNFSLNYVTVVYDLAGGNSDRRWRFSAGVDVNVGLYEPLRGAYPDLRGRGSLSAGLYLKSFCNRIDVFSEQAFGNNGVHSTVVQATCLWSLERGLGWFIRSTYGPDDYNSAFYSDEHFRFQLGFTIGRLRFFGSD